MVWKLKWHHRCNRSICEIVGYFLSLKFVFLVLIWGKKSSRIKAINIVRDRTDLPKLVERLMVLVADHTIAEEMLRKPDMEDLLVIILLGTADSAAVAANYLTGATIFTQFSSR